jgi:hypothetical protein
MLREPRGGFGHAAIELRHRLADLRFPPFVSGHCELAFELRARQAQRFERAHELGVAHGAALLDRPLAFDFLEALLYARFCIDESFSCISHINIIRSL